MKEPPTFRWPQSHWNTDRISQGPLQLDETMCLGSSQWDVCNIWAVSFPSSFFVLAGQELDVMATELEQPPGTRR